MLGNQEAGLLMFILQEKKFEGMPASWIKAQCSCQGPLQHLIHSKNWINFENEKVASLVMEDGL